MSATFNIDHAPVGFVTGCSRASIARATRLAMLQEKQIVEQRLLTRLEDSSKSLRERLDAYLTLANEGRKRYLPGDSIPSATQLGKYLGRHRSSVSDMRCSTNVNRDNYDTLLCLAAIYPVPAQGQSSHKARVFRLKVADVWLAYGSEGSLLEWLLEVVKSPDDFEI